MTRAKRTPGENEVGHGMLFAIPNRASVRAPNYSGHIEIDGVSYQLVGWLRTGDGISIRVNRGKPKAAPAATDEGNKRYFDDDPEKDPF